jgi:hypothetical protein
LQRLVGAHDHVLDAGLAAREGASARGAVAKLDEGGHAVGAGLERGEACGDGGLADAPFAHHEQRGREATRRCGSGGGHASGRAAMASITSCIMST